MNSLQTIAIKNIIDNISDNEELLSIKKHIEKRYKDNINQKHKEDYWGKEDGKFDDRLRQTVFSETTKGFDCQENNVEYKFYPDPEYAPLLIRDLNGKYWRISGEWDDFIIRAFQDRSDPSRVTEPSKEILDYAIFLWKHKSNISYSE